MNSLPSTHAARYAVLGNPIAHSLSPLIHSLFAEQTKQHIVYEKILVPTDGFATTLDDLQQNGWLGVNVTLPFKLEAWQLVDERSERAELAGSVNMIVFRQDGTRFGDNTDGIGLTRDLIENCQQVIAQKKILILGAGGGVRGVLLPLLQLEPASITIANRTESRAIELASQFAKFGNISAKSFASLGNDHYDIIINGTSASLQEEVPAIPEKIFHGLDCCYDMVYGKKLTRFLTFAQQNQAKHCFDGLGMLVEQAAEAFYLWRGVKPETKSVLKKIRETL